MAWPTITPQIALTSVPLEASPSFIDVSTTSSGKDRLKSARIRRGRSHERARVDAGEMTLLLRNDDGWLDPWNIASQYYGNLLSANQADVETDTTGLTSRDANCTIARTTAQAASGVASLRVTAIALGTEQAGTPTGTSGIPVIASRQYTAVVWFRASAGSSPNCATVIDWYKSDGTYISSSQGGYLVSSDSAWQYAYVTANAPALAGYAAVSGFVQLQSAAAYVDMDKFGLFGGSLPDWSGGGRNGNVQPRTKIKLPATYSAVDYDLFTGYIESIKPVWNGERYADTEIVAVDGFTILGRTKLVDTAHYDKVMSLTPRAFYRLGEGGIANVVNGLITMVDSSGNARDGTYKQSVNFGHPGALPTEANNAIELQRGLGSTSGGWAETASTACPSGTGDWSVEVWVWPRSFGQSPVDRLWHVVNVGGQSMFLALFTDGTLNFVAQDPNGGTLDSGTAALTIGRWNHVVAVKSGTTGPANWALYIDSVDVSGTATLQGTGNLNVTRNPILIGGFDVLGVQQGAFDGFIDEFAVYDTALSAGDVSDLFDAAHGLTAPALAGARIDALLDVAGWPAGDRDIDTGQFMMRPVTESLTNTFLLPYLQSLEEAEGYPAALFIDGAGKVVFQDRAHATPSGSGTFGDLPGIGELPLSRKVSPPVRDDSNLWTSLTGQSVDGEPQTVTGTDEAMERWGPSSPPSLSGLQNNDDADVLTLVTDLFDRYNFPADRAESLVVQPQKDPTNLWPLVLGLDLNARIAVNRHTLPGAGSPLLLDQRIEGVEHSIEPGNWETTWRTVPT